MTKYVYVVYENPKGQKRTAKVYIPKKITSHPERKLMTQQYTEREVHKWNPGNKFLYWAQSKNVGNVGRRKTTPMGRTNWG